VRIFKISKCRKPVRFQNHVHRDWNPRSNMHLGRLKVKRSVLPSGSTILQLLVKLKQQRTEKGNEMIISGFCRHHTHTYVNRASAI